MYVRVGANWSGFFLGDTGGPRGVNDPLWPLDTLFGVRDAVEIGAEGVRGVPVTHYRLTIDLARADAALPAGVTVPGGPYVVGRRAVGLRGPGRHHAARSRRGRVTA
jgi:hypothetical protein